MKVFASLRIAAVLLLVSQSAVAAGAHWLERGVTEFRPTAGNALSLPFRLEAPATVSVEIYSSDGARLRVLESSGELPAGDHELRWDGRDDHGVLVPDEAYVPVLVATAAGGERIVDDPRTYSGGETLDDVKSSVDAGTGAIRYRLSRPARVLVRAGIGGGAMMRSIAEWAPRPAGAVVERWDGYDADGLMRVLDDPRGRVLVTAFALPARSIITVGNAALSYVEYAKARGEELGDKAVPAVLERNGERLSRYYYSAVERYRVPRIEVTTIGNPPKTADGAFLVREPLSLRVDVPDVADRRLLETSSYEVGFFLDGDFVAEEERGYLPLTWQLHPRQLGEGRKVLTVNLSTLDGLVAVKSIVLQAAP
ncbi:MAG: FlgD immunoglobulin-like domain containing protein [Pseudomonadota bacterium]